MTAHKIVHAVARVNRGLQRRQHFLRMFLRLHLGPDFFDPPVRPDEKRDAMDAQVFPAHESFLPPNAISLDYFLLFIRQQREWQFEFRHELVVRLHRVGAHAEHDCIESLEPREGVAKLARLECSTGGVVLRVEIEHDDTTAQLMQRERRTAVRERGEVRRRSAFE